MWAVVKASVQLLVVIIALGGDTVIIISAQQRGPFWPGVRTHRTPLATGLSCI